MIYAFSKHRPSSEWYMKISDKRFIKISTIVNYLGLSISLVLPQYHVITGCDTTSYFYGIGKIKPLKKLMQAESKVSYITRLGERSDISASLIRDTVNFIKEICYNGSEIESPVDVRVKIYKSMKTKSSQSLPPDPKSMEQHIRRCNCQLMIWLSCDQANHQCISLDGGGWIVKNEQMQPIWFLGK